MGKIQELSSLLTNQIAAGEVVEKPASVIKELVENAIDANSTKIDVIIEEAGLSKIQVIDNGDGMLNEDAVLAFKRHATSKLYTQEDLFRIKTLGFRGEALPSIASVSYVTLETSTGESSGKRVYLKAGEVLEEAASAARKGTSITVEQLFFNTPARLKFVSSLQRETANIADLINRFALSHPHIAFTLTSEGNQLLQTTGNGQLKQTIAGVYSPAMARQMREVIAEDLDFKVTGFVSLPELTRSNRQYISLFINGRYIKNYALNQAIINGYETKLMIGRYPVAVLNIQMDHVLVDVNVHPTKQQVRISKEKELGELIKQAIHSVMNAEVRIPSALPKRFNDTFSKRQDDAIRVEKTSLFEEKNLLEPIEKINEIKEPNVNGYHTQANNTHTRASCTVDRLADEIKSTEESSVLANEKQAATECSDGTFEKADNIDVVAPHDSFIHLDEPLNDLSNQPIEKEVDLYNFKLVNKNDAVSQKTDTYMEQKAQSGQSVKATSQFPELHYFGQMHGTYLFAENEKGLYIVDQHAAQERIKYEAYRVSIGNVAKANQGLLIPLVLDYPMNEYLLIKERLALLEEVGIHLSLFGQTSFLMEEHPMWIKEHEVEETVRGLIDMLLERGKISIAKFREDTAIMMSCKHSIKANHYLNSEQARTLLSDLSKCENPYNCPHGRPVLIHLTNKDMEKMFKRIQDR